MKISYSVMAHPRRKEWAESLAEQIDCPIAWDTDSTVWNTRKKALLLAPADSDFHVVIQDDAILCADFKDKAEKFINEHKDKAVQLYFGNRSKEDKTEMATGLEKGFILRKFCAWGVAIGTPTAWIPEMIQFGDGYPAWQDDTKIKYFLAHKGYQTAFPMPCLVDHRRMKENPTLTGCADSDRYSPYFIDGVQEPHLKPIPKTIHQVWIGDQSKKPQNLMDTWKMDGWDYVLWTEKEIDALNLENRPLYDYYLSKKCYHGAADVVRVEVIERFGGVYIDADTERLLPIDDIMEDCTFWGVWSNMEGRVANGVIAAIPKHPILVNYRKAMGEAVQVDPPWSTIGGTLFTEMIFAHQDEYTKLMPTRTFYPFDSKGVRNTARHKNYARHYWNAAKVSGGNHRFYGKH